MTTTGFVTVPIVNRPGTLAEAATILAKEKINVDCVQSDSVGEFGWVRFCTNNLEKTEKVLRKNGYPTTTTECVEVPVANRPGELARITKMLGDNNINIQTAWATSTDSGSNSTLCLATSDVAATRRVLGIGAPIRATISR